MLTRIFSLILNELTEKIYNMPYTYVFKSTLYFRYRIEDLISPHKWSLYELCISLLRFDFDQSDSVYQMQCSILNMMKVVLLLRFRVSVNRGMTLIRLRYMPISTLWKRRFQKLISIWLLIFEPIWLLWGYAHTHINASRRKRDKGEGLHCIDLSSLVFFY